MTGIPQLLFSKLSKDVTLSHNLPSTVDLQRQEIKKNNMLYNMLENKCGNALLLRRDMEKKKERTRMCCFGDPLWLPDCPAG